MIAYFDRDLRYRFLNKALADWLELPRSRDPRADAARRSPARRRSSERDAADRARRWRASGSAVSTTFDHPTRGRAGAAVRIYSVARRATARCRASSRSSTDVTEQRVAERALRESEARFRRIANSAPVMMWVTRLDRTRDFVNDAYVEFVGGTRGGGAALDWRTRIHPDDVDRIVAESIAGEASAAAVHARGPLPARATASGAGCGACRSRGFGPDGELTGFIGVASDITLAKEAELELEGARSRSGPPSSARARRGSARSSRRCSKCWCCSSPTARSLELNRKEAAWRDPNPRAGGRQQDLGRADARRPIRSTSR